MINYTDNYFDLKIIKISEIKLHEKTETFRLRNIFDRITKDRFLLNPVIVGKYKKELILIDGANRLKSLIETGCKLIIAQIVDYMDDKIKLKKWNHLVYDFHIDNLQLFCKNNCIEHKNAEKVKKLIKQSLIVSDLQQGKRKIIKLSTDFIQMIKQINDITKLYFGKFEFDRSEEEIKIGELKKYTRRKGTLIEFPDLSKKQIVNTVKNHIRIPAGITRHILDNRVLHIKYDINKLFDDSEIEKKNNELRKYLLEKIDNNKVRQYTESVIVFDE